MKRYFLIAACLAVSAVSGDEQEIEVEEIVKKEILNLPNFPDKPSVVFFESFQGSSLSSLGWVPSTAEEYSNQQPIIDDTESAYEGDKALYLGKKHVRYGISKKLDKPLNMDEDEIVIQFETRALEKISCSGAYLKFVSEVVSVPQGEFSEKTDYVVMFGPDKCGNSPKLHTIFRHKNPISGEYEEKHMQDLKKPDNDKLTHVYTLHINNREQTVKVLVDQSEKGVALATAEQAFDPSFLPPKEIDDPEDKKPEEWVDEARIVDPDAEKPVDWVDVEFIVDPESTKPEDWDEEEDGEWEPAQIDNPEYKGPWKAPMIDNPDYKGVWSPKRIDNPNYFEQAEPLKTLPKVTHVYVEVLANDEGISFDNILITTNADNAKVLAESHALEKQKVEKDLVRNKEAKLEKEERDRKLNEEFGLTSVLEYASGEVKDFYANHPMEVIGGSSVLVLLLVYVFFLRSSVDKTEEAAKKKDDDKDTKEEEEEEEEEEAKKSSVRRRPRKAD